MKSFSEFIIESNSEAPYGVIFDGPNKVYIGTSHDKPIVLSDELKEKVLNIAKEHGVWYEGNGGDIASNVKMFGSKKDYKGSWDDLVADTLDGYPIPFMAVMFANVDVNHQDKKNISPNKSIFDSLLSHQDKVNYFNDKRKYDAKQLTKFLKQASEKGVDFLELSKLPATEDNLKKFFKSGEKLTWPPNWTEYPNKLGKMVKQSEDIRNGFLLKQKAGVYVVGAGHLIELKKMKKSLKTIGGEKANS